MACAEILYSEAFTSLDRLANGDEASGNVHSHAGSHDTALVRSEIPLLGMSQNVPECRSFQKIVFVLYAVAVRTSVTISGIPAKSRWAFAACRVASSWEPVGTTQVSTPALRPVAMSTSMSPT